jgi:4-hydroxybenzoate polyprenyltransferase
MPAGGVLAAESSRPVGRLPAGTSARCARTRKVGRGAELLRLIRFRAWAHFLVLPLAAADLDAPRLDVALALLRGVAIAFLVLGFGYLANAIGDREMDRDPEKNPLVGRPRGETRLEPVLAVLALAALALAATGPTAARVATLVSIGSGWAYSLGPRGKGLPVVGTLMNVLNFAPLLCVGLAAGASTDRLFLIVPAFAGLLVQNQLIHEAADAQEDRGGALRTTFLVLGPAGAAALAALAGAGLLAVAIRMLGQAGITPAWALLTAPFVVGFPWLLARFGRSPARMARVRVAQRACAAVGGALLMLLLL